MSCNNKTNLHQAGTSTSSLDVGASSSYEDAREDKHSMLPPPPPSSRARSSGLQPRLVTPQGGRKRPLSESDGPLSDTETLEDEVTMAESGESSGPKRGRGRPALRPENVGKTTKEAFARRAAEAKARKERETDVILTDPGTSAGCPKAIKSLEDEVVIQRELRMEPPLAAAVRIREALAVIRKIAQDKSHKGTTVRSLYEAASAIGGASLRLAECAGSTALETPPDLGDCFLDLQAQIKGLQKERDKLRGEIELLKRRQAEGPPSSEATLRPSPPLSPKPRIIETRTKTGSLPSGRNRNRIIDSSESDSSVAPPARPRPGKERARSTKPVVRENISLKATIEEAVRKVIMEMGIVPTSGNPPPTAEERPLPKKSTRISDVESDAYVAGTPEKGKKKSRKGKRKGQKGEGAARPPPPAPDLPPTPSPQSMEARASNPGKETWATVVARRPKAKTGPKGPVAIGPSALSRTTTKPPNKGDSTGVSGTKATPGRAPPPKPKPTVRAPKPSNRAAVSLTCPAGQYEEALTRARAVILPDDLKRMGIDDLKVRRSQQGGMLFEIPGPDKKEGARALASALDSVVGLMEGVKVSIPTKMADIKIRDLMLGTNGDEVAATVARVGICGLGEVRVGVLTLAPGGSLTVRVSCPVAAARKLVVAKKVQFGWTKCRVEALEAKPLQCFKCLERGHVRERCPNTIDRSLDCFRCGSQEHKARECTRGSPYLCGLP